MRAGSGQAGAARAEYSTSLSYFRGLSRARSLPFCQCGRWERRERVAIAKRNAGLVALSAELSRRRGRTGKTRRAALQTYKAKGRGPDTASAPPLKDETAIWRRFVRSSRPPRSHRAGCVGEPRRMMVTVLSGARKGSPLVVPSRAGDCRPTEAEQRWKGASVDLSR
mgnify:CR=1 FL=1